MDTSVKPEFLMEAYTPYDVVNTTLYGNASFESTEGPKPMPVYARVLIIIMYSTISVLSIGGNVIVCYIVLAYQRMRTVTNYFIVNLACSDILMAVLCIPLTFIANLLLSYWPFGRVMCPIVSYAQVVAVFLSAFTLVAISLDRFRAVICPLSRKLRAREAMVIIASIWILSLLVPLPIALFSKITQREDLYGVMRDQCVENWPTDRQKMIYSLVILKLQYFVPLFVLAFTYTWIGVVIWVKKPPGEAQNNRDQRIAASKRKMVKMMITVVIIYGLCWLPLHTITIIGDLHVSIWSYEYIQILWIAAHWLAMSNCCYNPMVYCWMNSRFRNGFKHVFNKFRCSGKRGALDGRMDHSGNLTTRNYTCVYDMREPRISMANNRAKINHYKLTQPRNNDNSSHSSSSGENVKTELKTPAKNGYNQKALKHCLVLNPRATFNQNLIQNR